MNYKLDESNTILHPAVYNQKGLEGDFEVYGLDLGDLFSLSGRMGPYTSIPEWFNGAGNQLLQNIQALLYTDPAHDRKPGAIKTPDWVSAFIRGCLFLPIPDEAAITMSGTGTPLLAGLFLRPQSTAGCRRQ